MGIENLVKDAFAHVVGDFDVYSFRVCGASWQVAAAYHGTFWTIGYFETDTKSIIAYPLTKVGFDTITDDFGDEAKQLRLGKEAFERANDTLLIQIDNEGSIYIPDGKYDVAGLLTSRMRAESNDGIWDVNRFGEFIEGALERYGESIDGKQRFYN